jgi:Domain of unknown function (DUF222)
VIEDSSPGAPVVDDAVGLADELQSVVEAEARLAAYKLRRVVELAAHRPDCLDVPAGQPGARTCDHDDLVPGSSEFFADELAAILNCSRKAAAVVAGQAFALCGQLRATFDALEGGGLDWPRARLIADELGGAARDTHPALIAEIEAAVLPVAAELSVRRLQARLRAELLTRDPDAAERRRRTAEQGMDLTLRPAPDGMAELLAALPRARAQAIWDTVNQLARQAKTGGDERPLGVLRVAILEELVTRPWAAEHPPVTAQLTVHAPLFSVSADADGQVRWLGGAGADPTHTVPTVNGQPITAGALRDLLHRLDALSPGGLHPPAGGSLLIALHDPDTGRLRAVLTRAELERLVRRGCPDHPAEPGCDCPVLDRPPPTDRYPATPTQRRFITTRDRSCRHPGCSNRAGWADLDHQIPHDQGGATCCTNLCCLCRRHRVFRRRSEGCDVEAAA